MEFLEPFFNLTKHLTLLLPILKVNKSTQPLLKQPIKNTTSTSEAVDKVKNAVVSVITYSDSSNQGLFEKEDNSDSQISSEGSGVIYKKEGKYAYLVTNTHVINGAKKK